MQSGLGMRCGLVACYRQVSRPVCDPACTICGCLPRETYQLVNFCGLPHVERVFIVFVLTSVACAGALQWSLVVASCCDHHHSIRAISWPLWAPADTQHSVPLCKSIRPYTFAEPCQPSFWRTRAHSWQRVPRHSMRTVLVIHAAIHGKGIKHATAQSNVRCSGQWLCDTMRAEL
jgi:hypothetical protein